MSQNPNTKILIVDDSDTNREYLNYILNCENYNVIEAKDGLEGLEVAKKSMPQLIITDILMPVMDGYEMVRNLKQNKKYGDIKIIFYTAQFSEQEAIDLVKMFGTVHYLNKPAERQEILETVKKALNEEITSSLTKKELNEISKQHLTLLNNKLYQKVNTLEKLNQELEERIAERTKELEILNRKLHEESIRDPLTQAFNRRYLDETLAREISRSKRKDESFSVIMIDIDHFKEINDKYGHQTGDLVLVQLSNKLKEFLRKEDLICRYGGEEFLLIIFDVDRGEIFKKIDFIREEIENMKIGFSKTGIISITISIGISIFPEQGRKIDDLIKSADQALYLAKNSGRNQTILYEATTQGKK